MDSPEAETFRTALSGLLASDAFQRSPALGRLLTYLVDQVLAGQAETLKESVIGHELYDRPASYNPKLDSLVRVSANRLRNRLEEHYRANPSERVRIILPRGSYVPRLEILEDVAPRSGNAADVSADTVPSGSYEDAFETGPLPLEPGPRAPAAWLRKLPGSRGGQVAFFVCVLLLVGLGTVLWTHKRHLGVVSANKDWSVRPFARLGGSQQFGAFSPDGSRLAFTSTTTQNETKAIYIQETGSEEARHLTTGIRPAWSPDGKRIAFLRPETNGKRQVLVYTLATGTEAKVAELEGLGPWLCLIPRLSWSRDGSILYSTASVNGARACGLVAIDVANHSIRPLLQPSTLVGDLEPAVSPDGETIAFMRGIGLGACDMFLMSARGGEARRITFDGVDIVGSDWAPDGKALIVASNREGGVRKLWRFPVDGGAPEALTDGSSAPTFPSVNADGKEINFTQFHVTAPIWKTEAGKAVEILDNQSRNDLPMVSPDGKTLLYTSDRAGQQAVWVSHADGSESKPLLRGIAYETASARWSPDGRQVVMECHLARKTHICVSNVDGSGMHQLEAGNASQVQPSWSHNGEFIYFTSEATGHAEIYRFQIATGTVTPVTHRGGGRALESWDGKWIYIARGAPDGGLIVLPSQGTEQEWAAAENTPMLPELPVEAATTWDVNGDGIVYMAPHDASTLQLNLFDARTKTTRPFLSLGQVAAGTELSIGVLPDGRGIVYTAAHTHSELSMMSLRK